MTKQALGDDHFVLRFWARGWMSTGGGGSDEILDNYGIIQASRYAHVTPNYCR
jgi:hypothetical protein